MENRIIFSGAIFLLLTGSLGQVIPLDLECDLNFSVSVTNASNFVEFVGLTASEKGDAGSNITGSMLTCSCSASGLSPAQWLGHSGSSVSNGCFEPTAGINYLVVADHPGTAVQLHITNNTFTCAEAGNYTCVIGENRRQVLVLPVGVECGLTNVTVTASPDRPLVNGEAVTLQCSAVDPTGSGLSFQWFKDDLLIRGQSSSALMLSAVGQNDTGRYTCQVSHRLGTREVMFDLFLLQAPSQVTGVALFKAVRQGRPILRVTWTTPQSDVNISQYTLQYRRNGSTVWGSQATAPPSATSTILTGLDAGTEYNVRMRAVSAAGDGMWSGVQTERTFDNHEEQTAVPISTARLRLEVLTTNVCFNKAVKLLCQHPHVLTSEMFSTFRPGWKENGIIFALDGSMYRSVTQTNATQAVLELVPERSHFEPLGAHNYTCFLPLVGGGILESNIVLVSPQDKPLKPKMLNSIPGIWEARIHWVNADNYCFDSQQSCDLEYNITWSVTSGGSSKTATVPHPEQEFTITGLHPDTEYTVTVKAQCQADRSLSSQESTTFFTTQDSGNAALILTTFNETACFDVPLYLHCHHPDTSSHIEGNPVFGSLRVHWKRDRAVIAVDGSTYTIAQQSRSLTVLAITHRREDFRETINNSYFSCFIPLEDGTFLHSNELQTYLNVSNARLYNWTIFGKTLDWSLIVACSPLITPTTIFNVTVALPSANGTERHSFISNETTIDLNVSLPHDEGIGVFLQILEYEVEPVHFHLNSSKMYACLGETYKMNCTMTESFHSCNISIPSWYKDGKEFVCFDDSNCTMKPEGNQIEELSVNISHTWSEHVYFCAAYHSPFPKCQHQSNNFTVPLLRRPLRPVLNVPIPGATTLSFTWTHNNVCFSDCMYNISWWDPFESVYVVVDGTNYTIDGLQPGSDYNVTICAVCEGALNCTEPQQYRTVAQEPGLSTGRIAGIVVGVLAPLAIGIAVLVIIIVLFKKNPKMKEKARKLFTRQPKKKEEQEERST